MPNRKVFIQKDLFESSKSQELNGRIKELDILIKRALKNSNYDQARTLIQEQEQIITELVSRDEIEMNRG